MQLMIDSTFNVFDRYDRKKTFGAFFIDGSSRLDVWMVPICNFS